MNDISESERLYGDIIELPRHIGTVHKPMPIHDRAAQFAPFAALTGYDDMVREQGRLTEGRTELSEQELELLDRKLYILCSLAEEGEAPVAEFTFFEPDKYKSGGRYLTIKGRIREVDVLSRRIILCVSEDTADRKTPDTEIPLEYITNINSEFTYGIDEGTAE